MILVDTSVLIDFLTGRNTVAVRYLEGVLSTHADEVRLTPIVVQEILQGARDEQEWTTLAAYLASQQLLAPVDLAACHVEAARIFFECRRRGLSVRSTTDCVIAQIALEHGCALLHDDRDFRTIAKVRPLVLLPERSRDRPAASPL